MRRPSKESGQPTIIGALHEAAQLCLIAVIMTLAIAALGGAGNAANLEVLPSQQSPPQLPSQPASPPPLSPQQERTIPPRLPMGLGNNTREIPLPKIFRGCWSGSVPAIDSLTPLQPDEPPIIWLTKLYTLCYQQSGMNGRWKLTFADSSVADSGRVSDQRQVIKVKAVPAPDEAVLSAYMHFRAASIGMFGMPTENINTLDELADLHCRMTPSRDAIEVRASVFVESNTEPYAEMSWHTILERTAAPE
jgi:hypothetical protein